MSKESDDTLEWIDGGNLGLDQCHTEEELEEKLGEFLQEKSEELGAVTYRIGDKTYVIGLTMNVLELEGEETIFN